MKDTNYTSVYDLSSSNYVYIETILKFPNYKWSPHGITHNSNIKKEDVLRNPQLPWIYTDFTQSWVNEEWVNSFPYYNERIIITADFIPNFVKEKVINDIPLKYSSKLLYDSYPEILVKDILIDYEIRDFLCIDKSSNYDILEYVNLGKDTICIFGVSFITFEFIDSYKDIIRFEIDKDTKFEDEIEKFFMFRDIKMLK
jgi:hypothetical protein